eukprot:CAMPEP_0184698902 /NCGR_PEP_ID=MMETSP0313-20130426/5353_1 /TAXON_ID=2792 /ORGANISM="Porphyridium aerugineum, Strain SAG 1380-2" /LENGTH=385 /DNA_ID=CAMNT_0027157903 /DNA_START=202 /DNA_END=1355 /DNA_ORIENTATION=+
MDIDPPPSPLGVTALDSKFTTPVRPSHQDRQTRTNNNSNTNNNEEQNQHNSTNTATHTHTISNIQANTNANLTATHTLFSTTTTPYKFIPTSSSSALDTPGPSPLLGGLGVHASPDEFMSYTAFLSPLPASRNQNHLNMGLMMMPSVSPLRNPSSAIHPSTSPSGLGVGYSPLPAWLSSPGLAQDINEGGTRVLVTPQSIWKTHGTGTGIGAGTGVQVNSSPDASNRHQNPAIHGMHAQGAQHGHGHGHGHGHDFHMSSFFESPRNVFQQFRANDMDYNNDINAHASGNAQRPPLNLTGPSHYRSMSRDDSDAVENEGEAGTGADHDHDHDHNHDSETQTRAKARPARKKSYKRKLDFTPSASGSGVIQGAGSAGARPILMGTDS